MDFCEVQSWQRHTSSLHLCLGGRGVTLHRLHVALLLLMLCFTSGTFAQSQSATPTNADGSRVTQRVQVTAFPTSLALPPLNATHPFLEVRGPGFAVSSQFITLNICGLTSAGAALVPRVVVSHQVSDPFYGYGPAARQTPAPDSGGVMHDADGIRRPNIRALDNLWPMSWDKGFANWTFDSFLDSAGFPAKTSILLGLGMDTLGNINQTLLQGVQGNLQIQLGWSADGFLQSLSSETVLLGDTTHDAALLFSPLLRSEPHDQPTYPNYTLPPAQLALGQSPFSAAMSTDVDGLSADLSLVVVPTGSSPTNNGLDNSLCAVQAAGVSAGSIADVKSMLVNATTQWTSVGGQEGYRTFWVVGDLLPQTNYTAWVFDGQGGMSQPMWFTTKPADFPCQLVVPSSLCPGVAYAAPISQNTTSSPLPSTPYPISVLPANMTSRITSSLESFSTSVLSGACGRDLYSHVVSCADCFASYRDWVCRVVVPQCAATSPSPAPNSVPSSATIEPRVTQRSPSNPRLPGVVPPYDYTELLPCLSVCNAVDRNCVVTLNFRCPLRNKVGNQSYAFYGEDDDEGDGSADTGQASLDRWGNRWCNG